MGSFSPAQAATPAQPDSAGLRLALERLGHATSVLYVAAHPDDENTNLLAWLAGDRALRAAYLSMTRGDGGQNLIGSEQGDALGLIRTEELLAARRIDGAEQMFTRARDFGFSKTPEETLRIWGKDAVLSDVVWAIRRYRPDVVITRFPSQHTEGQHGHHTASAILAEEAFRLAGDPGYKLDPPRDLPPWKARRLFWNKSTWALKPGEDLSSFIKLDVGTYNPLLGRSFGEIAAEGRSMHKSQGFGVPRTRGPILEYFKQLAPTGEAPARGVLDGIDPSFRAVEGGARFAELIDQATRTLAPESPSAIVPLLVEADAALDAVKDPVLRDRKRAELAEVLGYACGLHAEAVAADPIAVPGAKIKIDASVINRSPAALTLKAVRVPGASQDVGKPIVNELLTVSREWTVPADARLSNPYWLDEAGDKGLFRVTDARLIGNPESPAAAAVELVIAAGNREFVLHRPVEHKWTDPVAGERLRPLELAPPVSVTPDASVLMFPGKDARNDNRPLRVRVKAAIAGASGAIRLELPDGYLANPPSAPFTLKEKGDELDLDFTIRAREVVAAPGTLRAIAEISGKTYSKSARHIEYAHIPIQVMLADASVRLVPVRLARAGTRIGYIAGAGDEVPAALRQVGYEVTMLGEDALTAGDLSRFDAIVTGVRAFNTNERLRHHRKRLLDWVAAGGTLVVQYNTNNRLAKLDQELGPHPFEIGRERVTDEDAPVALELPDHPVLHHPNAIEAGDFAGWIQERGLYFANKWDPAYETPLRMNDPGEPPLKGSLLYARHGKGVFVYTGLAFFRELPAGVPGAYRLFANLVARPAPQSPKGPTAKSKNSKR